MVGEQANMQIIETHTEFTDYFDTTGLLTILQIALLIINLL